VISSTLRFGISRSTFGGWLLSFRGWLLLGCLCRLLLLGGRLLGVLSRLLSIISLLGLFRLLVRLLGLLVAFLLGLLLALGGRLLLALCLWLCLCLGLCLWFLLLFGLFLLLGFVLFLCVIFLFVFLVLLVIVFLLRFCRLCLFDLLFLLGLLLLLLLNLRLLFRLLWLGLWCFFSWFRCLSFCGLCLLCWLRLVSRLGFFLGLVFGRRDRFGRFGLLSGFGFGCLVCLLLRFLLLWSLFLLWSFLRLGWLLGWLFSGLWLFLDRLCGHLWLLLWLFSGSSAWLVFLLSIVDLLRLLLIDGFLVLGLDGLCIFLIILNFLSIFCILISSFFLYLFLFLFLHFVLSFFFFDFFIAILCFSRSFSFLFWFLFSFLCRLFFGLFFDLFFSLRSIGRRCLRLRLLFRCFLRLRLWDLLRLGRLWLRSGLLSLLGGLLGGLRRFGRGWICWLLGLSFCGSLTGCWRFGLDLLGWCLFNGLLCLCRCGLDWSGLCLSWFWLSGGLSFLGWFFLGLGSWFRLLGFGRFLLGLRSCLRRYSFSLSSGWLALDCSWRLLFALGRVGSGRLGLCGSDLGRLLWHLLFGWLGLGLLGSRRLSLGSFLLRCFLLWRLLLGSRLLLHFCGCWLCFRRVLFLRRFGDGLLLGWRLFGRGSLRLGSLLGWFLGLFGLGSLWLLLGRWFGLFWRFCFRWSCLCSRFRPGWRLCGRFHFRWCL